MKTTVNNIASENVTSFVINEDMLNEKKAMKYISKPNMVAAINDICAAIIRAVTSNIPFILVIIVFDFYIVSTSIISYLVSTVTVIGTGLTERNLSFTVLTI
jgi:hypothetical protein